MIEAWHFVGATLRDGRPVPPDGEWLEHDGPLVLCSSGLHASERLIDALNYAPGSTLCRVTLDGEIVRDENKVCARRRRIEWRMDAEDLLRRFARNEALRVIDLWDAPAVVRQYLETGDVGLQVAARDAARPAAAARDAAWGAAGAAAGAAVAAGAAAAASAATWDAARAAVAAGAAAGAAAAAGAGAAARPAAVDAAAAWVAARDAADKRLTAMVQAERASC